MFHSIGYMKHVVYTTALLRLCYGYIKAIKALKALLSYIKAIKALKALHIA